MPCRVHSHRIARLAGGEATAVDATRRGRRGAERRGATNERRAGRDGAGRGEESAAHHKDAAVAVAVDGPELHGAFGLNGGRARHAVDERELAEARALADRRDVRVVHEDLRASHCTVRTESYEYSTVQYSRTTTPLNPPFGLSFTNSRQLVNFAAT